MEPTLISAILISAMTVIGWLVTQTQAKSKAQRQEVRDQRIEIRGRRKHSLLADQYMFRLETALSKKDIPLPPKPEGLDLKEGADW